jgi:hypothetical protein
MRTAVVVASLGIALGCGKGGGESGNTPEADPSSVSESKAKGKETSPAIELINASFDDGKPGLHGWQTQLGAANDPAPGGNADTESRVTITEGSGRGGSAALELAGDAKTSRWMSVHQPIEVTEGQQVVLSFATRSDGLVRQGKQWLNSNATVSFYDASDERLNLEATFPFTGSRPWHTRTLATTPAPKGTARATVGFFSSLTGTMWVDDVTVQVRDVAAWSKDGAADAWDHLVERVSATYPFSPVAAKRAEWREGAAALRDKALAAGDRDAFAAVVIEALKPLNDVHVTVKVYGQQKGTVEPRQVDPSWNFDAVKAMVEETVLNDQGFGVARLKGGIGYVLISTWEKGRDPIDRVMKAMAQLSDVRAWIVDVRVNQGGAENMAALFASRFATKPVVFAKHRFRAGDGYDPWNERVLRPDADDPDTRKVVVLQSPLCMSSTEAFLAMMSALPTVTIVGLQSRGATRNPGPLYLTSDITVMSSRWEAALPDGTLIEYVGIAPDVVVDEPASAYAQADPTLDKALELLR